MLRDVPVEDALSDTELDQDDRLKVNSRDSDNTIIICLLMEIRDLLIELTD